MSEENVEIVRMGYDAFARRDLDAIGAVMRKHVAPNAEFESVLTGQIYTGVQGAYELAADLWETLPDYGLAVEEIIDRGDRVVAVLRISGTGGSSGVPVSQQVAFVWTFEGGKIVRGKSFTSRAEALEAAGLRE
jgi:ketosteroid isomerase-like protein